MVDDIETISVWIKQKRLTTLNAKNNDGETTLMIAVRLHKTMSVEVMLEAESVDLLTKNIFGETLIWKWHKKSF